MMSKALEKMLSGRHAMIDLETYSNRSDAVILSIGAVSFTSNQVEQEFYINVNRDTQKGRHVSIETISWWDKQSQSVKNALLQEPIVDLSIALLMFQEWLKDEKIEYLWSNGADFDLPIISHAYNQCGIEYPIQFWNHRCYRTVKQISDIKIERRIETHHNALDDARNQAIHLLEIIHQFKM